MEVDSPTRELPADQKAVLQQKYMSNPNRYVASRKVDAWSPDFCERIAPQAKRYAMSIVRCWSDAEEIVQEAFCRLIDASQQNATNHQEWDESKSRECATHESANHESTLQSEASGKAILFATIRNLSIDQLRKQSRQPYVSIDSDRIPDNHVATDESKVKHLQSCLEESMRQLPDNWSDALQLRVNGELSYQEISKVLKATHDQVRTWIYRARKQLQIDLKKKGLIDNESNSRNSIVETKQ